MTDWSAIQHAYGKASEIPALFAALSPDPTATVWHDLWSRLCHQGTVYSASFAALPYLLAAAERWKSTERAQPIILAASIVASEDLHGCGADPLLPFAWVVPRFHQLSLESLATSVASKVEFIYLLEATLSFEGDRLWGCKLDCLADGEFTGVCPHCGVDLYFVIGDEGCFTSVGEWVRHPETPRTGIEPNDGTMLEVGQRLVEHAKAAQQYEVAAWIRYVFGTGICPACASRFAVPDAIGAV